MRECRYAIFRRFLRRKHLADRLVILQAGYFRLPNLIAVDLFIRPSDSLLLRRATLPLLWQHARRVDTAHDEPEVPRGQGSL